MTTTRAEAVDRRTSIADAAPRVLEAKGGGAQIFATNACIAAVARMRGMFGR